jgi:hypothetical protein
VSIARKIRRRTYHHKGVIGGEAGNHVRPYKGMFRAENWLSFLTEIQLAVLNWRIEWCIYQIMLFTLLHQVWQGRPGYYLQMETHCTVAISIFLNLHLQK